MHDSEFQTKLLQALGDVTKAVDRLTSAVYETSNAVPPTAHKSESSSEPSARIICVDHRRDVVLSISPHGNHVIHKSGGNDDICLSEMFAIDE